jgi:hypothetical protein
MFNALCFDASTKVKYFACRQDSGGFQNHLLLFMIDGFVMTCQASLIDKLTAQRLERRRNFILRIDRMIWTLGYTCAAVNASG